MTTDKTQDEAASSNSSFELLERACVLIADEFLRCANNDCRCRQGAGLCNQCREAAIEFLNDVEKFKESNVC